jgi:hypothetical protein
MSALVVSSMLYIMLATPARCDTNPRLAKESSTTFLRLTSLRDDEGLWTARFGEYEVRTFLFLSYLITFLGFKFVTMVYSY